MRIQLAEKQEKRQTDIADAPVTEIQGAHKITETSVTKPGQQTDKTISGTPSTSINAKLPVCSASRTLTSVNENEINRGSDDDSSLTDLFQIDNMLTGNYADPHLENYFAPGNNSCAANNVIFAEQICGDSNRFTVRHAHFGRHHTPYTVCNNHTLYTPTTNNAPLHDHQTITRRAQSVSFANNTTSGNTQHAHMMPSPMTFNHKNNKTLIDWIANEHFGPYRTILQSISAH